MDSIGFTGTRNEITLEQKTALHELLATVWDSDRRQRPVFHHGACVGADTAAAVSAWELNYDVIAHPGQSSHGGDNEFLSQLAIEHSSEVRPTKTHFARNRDIVNESEVLIACPQYFEAIGLDTKGGTAYTVCFARRKRKPIVIIRPNGIVERE